MAAFKTDDFREAVRNILQDYQKEYQSIAQPVVEKIIQDMQDGKSLVKAVSDALSETSFFNANKEATVNAIYLAACAGYGVLPKMVVHEDAIKNTLLSDSWTPDKMPLSERIHGGSANMREVIITTIRKSMLASKTVKDMAMDLYDGYNTGKTVIKQAALPQYLQKMEMYARWAADGDMKMVQAVLDTANEVKQQISEERSPNLRAAYNDLINACKKFETQAIDKAVHTALEEKSRYHAERIARTEAARAWFDGFIAKNQNDADVWGYRWRLSSRHGLVPFDQCDVCANMDVGFGKGLYPKGKVPSIPRHPHCMCMLQIIYVWEIEDEKQFNSKKAREYIDSLPEVRQQQLFGIKGLEAYQAGGDWEDLLRGWAGFEEPESRFDKDEFELQAVDQHGTILFGGVDSLEQSKKRDHKIEITKIAINKVPLVNVSEFSDEQNSFLQEIHKEVLKTSMEENNSNEVLGIINRISMEKVFVKGDEYGVNPSTDINARVLTYKARQGELIYAHNHPSTNKFSFMDIYTFLNEDAIGTMSVVTNQGEIYLLNKNSNYVYNKVIDILTPLMEAYRDGDISHDDVVNGILKVCKKGGIDYEKTK